MFSSRDVVLRSERMNIAFKVGTKEDSISRDDVIRADIDSISQEIIENQENITFQLSGLLLRGIAVLYSRKTVYFVSDCKDAIARISLVEKTEPELKDKKSKKKTKAGLDPDTLRIWENLQPIEEIIESEKLEDIHIPENHDEVESFTSIRIHVPPPETSNDFEDDDMELTFVPNFNGPPEEPQDISINIFDEEVELTSKQMKNVVDQSPVIPLTELAKLIDDPSSTLCEREIITRQNNLKGIHHCAIELLEIEEEALQMHEEKVVCELDPHEDEPLISLPEPPIPEPEEREEEEEQPPPRLAKEDGVGFCELLPIIHECLKFDAEFPLSRIAKDGSKKGAIPVFYTALALHTDGVITLTQRSIKEEILVSRGPSFY